MIGYPKDLHLTRNTADMELDITRDYYPDTRHTVNVNEAIALMLGWMRHPVKPTHILVTENGIPDDELGGIFEVNGSIEEMLMEQRNHAINAFSKAVDDDHLQEEQDKLAQKILDNEDLLEKAAIYGMSIKTELTNKDNGKPSLLVVDKKVTKEYGETHITKSSLDEWAFNEHQIEILPKVPSKKPEAKNTNDKIESMEDTHNIYLSMHLLASALATKKRDLKKTNGEPNIENIATIVREHFSQYDQLPSQSTFTQSLAKGKKALTDSLPKKDKLSNSVRLRRLHVIALLTQYLRHIEKSNEQVQLNSESDISKYALDCNRDIIDRAPSVEVMSKIFREAISLYKDHIPIP